LSKTPEGGGIRARARLSNFTAPKIGVGKIRGNENQKEETKMSEVFYCYVVNPIDFFDGVVKAESVMTRENKASEEIRRDLSLGLVAALKRGWHGDISEGPYVFYFPGGEYDACLKRGFIFKQTQGGWTYVVSRTEMPWLEDCTPGTPRVEV
jgi:hypothetical protein